MNVSSKERLSQLSNGSNLISLISSYFFCIEAFTKSNKDNTHYFSTFTSFSAYTRPREKKMGWKANLILFNFLSISTASKMYVLCYFMLAMCAVVP